MESRAEPTGFMELVDNFEDKIPKYDPRSGEHFWAVILSYKVNPEVFMAGKFLLDHENLASISPPGCYFCEQMYTPSLAKRRCKGEG